MKWTRRHCLFAIGMLGAGVVMAKDAPQQCSLELKNLHTGEVL